MVPAFDGLGSIPNLLGSCGNRPVKLALCLIGFSERVYAERDPVQTARRLRVGQKIVRQQGMQVQDRVPVDPRKSGPDLPQVHGRAACAYDRCVRVTRLQEWLQARGRPLPVYETVSMVGPDHAPVFTLSVSIDGGESVSATANSKRDAAQAAAAVLWR